MGLRFIIWNCSMALHKKTEPLMSLRPDIALIAECANPDYVLKKAPQFKFTDAVWIGHSPHRGLGVFSFGAYLTVASTTYDPQFKMFLPLKIFGPHNLNVLAVWAYNYKSRHPAYRNGAPTRAALKHYRHFITAGPTIVAGDFNNSVIWDLPGKDGNFSNLVNDMQADGLVSVYHLNGNNEFGKESEPTCYPKKRRKRSYHVDYCFIPTDWISKSIEVSIGKPKDWVRHSRHVPLTVDIDWSSRGKS
jgi:hypothetical protein